MVNSNSNSNSDSNGKFSETFDEQYNRVMICNNACWLVGELAMRIPNQIVPLLTQVIDLLADILNLELFEKLENGLDVTPFPFLIFFIVTTQVWEWKCR